MTKVHHHLKRLAAFTPLGPSAIPKSSISLTLKLQLILVLFLCPPGTSTIRGKGCHARPCG